MYIKEIKANGFKSFADKINLELAKNFTGIVGPNGSGKSNIVDAIKWVLGEQSVKTLRSESMTDVIFNGSKNRDAMNSASVTIVFDNSDKHLPVDYEEVSIKRIVYKSGENEYYLNNEKCRLKDISNLFVDSFSSKESLNIISQGQISAIIGEKPEERRMIIEEAAGVLKYKRRKEESLRKLAKTHDNIDRVDMIIRELRERIIPLKEESEKAREYKSVKEELENVDIALIVNDIEKYSDIYNKNKEESEKLEQELSKNTTSNTKEETQLEKHKSKQIKLNEEISTLQKSIIDSNNKLADLNRQKELCKERTKYDTEDVKIKSRLIAITEEEMSLKSVLASLHNEKKSVSELIEKSNEVLQEFLKDYKVIEVKVNVASESLSNASKNELLTKNKIEILNNSLENNSKMPYSVKSVLDNPRLTGIKKTIGSIIETDSEYSTAIDIALGSSASVIVTENENSAAAAIDYLKQNKKGRATFFPMTVIKPKWIDEETLSILKNVPSFIGVASSLVRYDKEYDNIVKNVLGNIIVVDDINAMNSIAKRINYKYRVVTLDGEISHVGGSVTGGSIKQGSGVMADKFELQRLNTLLDGIVKDKEKLEVDLKELTTESEVIKNKIYTENTRLSELKGKLSSIDNQIEETSTKHNSVHEELTALSKSNKDELDEELKTIMEAYYKEEENKKALETKMSEKTNERKSLLELIEDTELTIKNQNSVTTSISNKLRSLEVESARASVLLDNLLNNLSESYSMTFERARESYELTIPESDARSVVSNLKNKLKSLGEVNLLSIEEYERVNTRYEFLDTQKSDLLESEKNLLTIINEMDETMESKFKETFDAVNNEFNKVFNNLFKGGEAHLVLTDPDNLLETGVEIIALPPGKKLKISQLSGGEMTLTAISLLFAIMNLKDVPFAILDEIEAALDEANVDKFGKYLDNYKGKTQMILITHKKKTMEYVDMLYGITMQESGVSKLVSVKLEDIK